MEGIPETFCFDSLPDDLEHIEPLLKPRLSVFRPCAARGFNCSSMARESFTPDDRYLLGETPEIRGLFVAAGFKSDRYPVCGGAGKVISDWIIELHPPMDLWDVDVRRTTGFQKNRRYLKDRTVESLGLLYAMHWPFRQPESARARRSTLHDRLAARGACFGEVAGGSVRIGLHQAVSNPSTNTPTVGRTGLSTELRSILQRGRPSVFSISHHLRSTFSKAPMPRRSSIGSAPTTRPFPMARSSIRNG